LFASASRQSRDRLRRDGDRLAEVGQRLAVVVVAADGGGALLLFLLVAGRVILDVELLVFVGELLVEARRLLAPAGRQLLRSEGRQGSPVEG
jgi:hypothetical protein